MDTQTAQEEPPVEAPSGNVIRPTIWDTLGGRFYGVNEMATAAILGALLATIIVGVVFLLATKEQDGKAAERPIHIHMPGPAPAEQHSSQEEEEEEDE